MDGPARHRRLDAEVDLLRFAERREGLVTRADARAAGMSEHQIRHRVRTGRWLPMAPGVWRLSGAAITWTQQLRAGLLWLGDEARVSGYAAGQLLRFDDFQFDLVEFVGPRGLRGRASGPFTVHTTHTLRPIDRVWVHGFPCTSASRTIIDLAARGISPGLLAKAIDSAHRNSQTSATFLRKQITSLRGPGRDGVRLIDSLMPDTGGHSQLERDFLRLMRLHGLPRPRCQAVQLKGSEFVARVDFDFEPYPLVVEVMGRLGYTSDEDRTRHAQRRNELLDLGFVVKEFTFQHVIEQPDYVVSSVRTSLRQMGASY